MSAGQLSAEAMFDSLTGFDEIAVKKFWGVPISTLSGNKKAGIVGDPMQFLRALAFIAERRAGLSDIAAHAAAQELTIGGVMAYFPDSTPEIDALDPETESGKELTPTG